MLAALVAVLAVFVTACGGGSTTKSTRPSAQQLLQQARQKVDQTDAVHFMLTSSGVQASGAAVTGGEGDIARPDKFEGNLVIEGAGLSGHVKVVSVGGTFYAQLPFTSHYVQVDPSRYGFGDPGQLLDKQNGISNLLTAVKNASYRGETRVNGEVVRHVHATIPGNVVGSVLTSADPSATFDTDVFIAPRSNEVRQVTLTGPFLQKGHNATYTVTLTHYGESVDISAPTG